MADDKYMIEIEKGIIEHIEGEEDLSKKLGECKEKLSFNGVEFRAGDRVKWDECSWMSLYGTIVSPRLYPNLIHRGKIDPFDGDCSVLILRDDRCGHSGEQDCRGYEQPHAKNLWWVRISLLTKI